MSRRIRARPADVVHSRIEERRRIVVRLGLHVLRQREERGAALSRIEHDGERLGEGSDDLFGLGDAIPITGHRPERVCGCDGWIVELLDLLQHRINDPVQEDVAADQQQRQTVGVSDGGSRDHVGAAGPDRRRGDHDLVATLCLGERDRGQRHRLFVVAVPCRQLILDLLERFAEARHVAVAEYGRHAGEHGYFRAVDDRPLIDEPANDGLRRRQANGFHLGTSGALERRAANRRRPYPSTQTVAEGTECLARGPQLAWGSGALEGEC